jgi:lipopolysaccharide transport system ATP-binding protein
MSDTIVRVEGVGKQFRIAGVQPRYRALRDSLAEMATAPFRRARAVFQGRAVEGSEQKLWALRDVSFEVRRGEVLGIIGRNGAGKSTLLKVLSRITPPTTGRITLDGRVGSLLEVGTGFHPELSGRDNVYLNGAILGMRRTEIARQFDDIVEFAEIEQFIDTPVKHYSSGMYMRLAFAVAAHMEPEILVVDEVLAVGDMAFQKKCLGKMEAVSKAGRTVLFVSHNMRAIRNLCRRCLLLGGGRVLFDGGTAEATVQYQGQGQNLEIGAHTAVNNPELRRGDGAARFTGVSIEDVTGQCRFEFLMGETVRLKFRYEVFQPLKDLYFFLVVGVGTLNVASTRQFLASNVQAGKTGEFTVELPDLCLRPNEYTLYIYLNDAELHPYDSLINLTNPLIVRTEKGLQELNFNPSQPNGFFGVPSRLVDVT